MILTKNPKSETKVDCICDNCGKQFTMVYKNLKGGKKKRNDTRDLCRSCICKLTINSKPQCQSSYWTQERKDAWKEYLKTCEGYQNRKVVPRFGKANGMYGKKHSLETRQKMSISRTGKTGENATAWKGGKGRTLNSMVKGYLHKVCRWYFKIHQKYRFTCANCGATNVKLDAHHIKPLNKIIKELLKNTEFKTMQEQYNYLIQKKKPPK